MKKHFKINDLIANDVPGEVENLLGETLLSWKDEYGASAIQVAYEQKAENSIKQWRDLDWNTSECDFRGRNILAFAVRSEHDDWKTWFEKVGFPKDAKQLDALCECAILQNDETLFIDLLSKGLKPWGFEDAGSCSVAHLLARKGWVKAMQILIDSGESITKIDFSKRTPLHEAVYGGNIDMVRLLLSKTEKFSRKHTMPMNKENKTPLAMAIFLRRWDICDLFVAHGVGGNDMIALNLGGWNLWKLAFSQNADGREWARKLKDWGDKPLSLVAYKVQTEEELARLKNTRPELAWDDIYTMPSKRSPYEKEYRSGAQLAFKHSTLEATQWWIKQGSPFNDKKLPYVLLRGTKIEKEEKRKWLEAQGLLPSVKDIFKDSKVSELRKKTWSNGEQENAWKMALLDARSGVWDSVTSSCLLSLPEKQKIWSNLSITEGRSSILNMNPPKEAWLMENTTPAIKCVEFLEGEWRESGDFLFRLLMNSPKIFSAVVKEVENIKNFDEAYRGFIESMLRSKIDFSQEQKRDIESFFILKKCHDEKLWDVKDLKNKLRGWLRLVLIGNFDRLHQIKEYGWLDEKNIINQSKESWCFGGLSSDENAFKAWRVWTSMKDGEKIFEMGEWLSHETEFKWSYLDPAEMNISHWKYLLYEGNYIKNAPEGILVSVIAHRNFQGDMPLAKRIMKITGQDLTTTNKRGLSVAKLWLSSLTLPKRKQELLLSDKNVENVWAEEMGESHPWFLLLKETLYIHHKQSDIKGAIQELSLRCRPEYQNFDKVTQLLFYAILHRLPMMYRNFNLPKRDFWKIIKIFMPKFATLKTTVSEHSLHGKFQINGEIPAWWVMTLLPPKMRALALHELNKHLPKAEWNVKTPSGLDYLDFINACEKLARDYYYMPGKEEYKADEYFIGNDLWDSLNKYWDFREVSSPVDRVFPMDWKFWWEYNILKQVGGTKKKRTAL